MEECWRMALRISQKAEPAQFLHSSGMFADISSTRAARALARWASSEL